MYPLLYIFFTRVCNTSYQAIAHTLDPSLITPSVYKLIKYKQGWHKVAEGSIISDDAFQI